MKLITIIESILTMKMLNNPDTGSFIEWLNISKEDGSKNEKS